LLTSSSEEDLLSVVTAFTLKRHFKGFYWKNIRQHASPVWPVLGHYSKARRLSPALGERVSIEAGKPGEEKAVYSNRKRRGSPLNCN